MHTLRVLHVAPELAPLSGDSAGGEVAEAICRGLGSSRHRVAVTAATLHDPERDPQRWGIARRLEPVPVPGDADLKVAIWEGQLQSGDVKALVADCDRAAEPMEALTRLALDLAAQKNTSPHVVHTWDTAPRAALVAREGSAGAAPAVVLSLSDPGAPLTDALREALAVADRVVVSSPSLARALPEVSPELMRALGDPKKLYGMVHGIDETRYGPERDTHLPRPFNAYDRSAKASLKREIQRKLGLPPRAAKPLIGAVGRFDLLDKETIETLADADVQLAFLLDPVRDVDAAAELNALAKRYPTRVAVRELPSSAAREDMAHRLLGGADFWLIPRAPRPGGFLELHALAYGAVPIAPRLGSFADVLVDHDLATGTGSGILFDPRGEELASALRRAARAYHRPGFAALVEQVMRIDLSWRTAGRRFADLYRQALRARAVAGQKVDKVVA